MFVPVSVGNGGMRGIHVKRQCCSSSTHRPVICVDIFGKEIDQGPCGSGVIGKLDMRTFTSKQSA